MLTSANTERDLFHERKSKVTWKQLSAKANIGTITKSPPWNKIPPFCGYYPCETKTSQETEKNLRKFTETVAEAKKYSYRQFICMWQVLWRIIMESSNNYTSSIRDKPKCRTSCMSKKKRNQQYYHNLDRMISGDRILWNAVAIWEMTKTSWQTGNLKMNEDLGSPSRTCFVRGGNLGRRCSDCWDWRIGKVRCIRNMSQKTECERSPDNSQKEGFFLQKKNRVADGAAKLSGSDYEFQEITLRRESTIRRENLSKESLGGREEFRLEE